MTPVLRTPHLSLIAWQSIVGKWPTQPSGLTFLGPVGVLPSIGLPSVTVHKSAPERASTPLTTFAMEGRTMTSCVVPSLSFTFGTISGCASMPRASPNTGMMVARTIPFDSTDAWVSTFSFGFQPLLELSADRVNQGAMAVSATHDCEPVNTDARMSRHRRQRGMNRYCSSAGDYRNPPRPGRRYPTCRMA